MNDIALQQLVDAGGWLDLSVYGGFSTTRLVELGLVQVGRDEAANLFYEHNRNYEPLVHMDRLDLAMYRDATGSLLLGSKVEALHPHERWHYHSPAGSKRWYETAEHATMAAPINDLALELRIDSDTMHAIESRRAGPLGPSRYWRVAQAPFWLTDSLLDAMDGRMTPTDMHDLVFHYATWLARNPDYQGMPPEIAQRMQGLGAVLEARKARA